MADITINLEDLQAECEKKFQELCEAAKFGGAATLDELADVAGLLTVTVAALRSIKNDAQ